MSFAHLHLHSGYSFLDGAIRMDRLCQVVQQRGMNAVAVTDHGNMHGALDFYVRAQQAGIKPIMGIEAYTLGPNKKATDRNRDDLFHMVLLAENQTGWRNLKKLVSRSYSEGFYYRPRMDWKMLEEHHEGLIATTACLGGPTSRTYHGWLGPRAQREGRANSRDVDGALKVAQGLQSIFGYDNFFLELQDNHLEEQYPYNEMLLEIGHSHNIRMVGTNDCHYVDPGDAEAHGVLMAIQRRQTVDEHGGHNTDQFYIKDEATMRGGYFQQHQHCIDTACEIADRCNVTVDIGDIHLPDFPCEGGRDEAQELRRLSSEGLARRFTEFGDGLDQDEYKTRLNHELDIIEGMGFPGYFLIVQDFINWAKSREIRVGPGRGSGAGSLVAWSLRITDLDPMPYDLLFERFLNPERVSMPDFDVDFCQERRGEVIEYVANRYGQERVGQIATFARLGGKSVIKDVARTMGLPFQRINEMTRHIPAFHEGKPVTLTPTFKGPGVEVRDGCLVGDPKKVGEARRSWGLFEVSDKLVHLRDSDPVFRKAFTIATQLEGLYRQAGTHAGGVVIGKEPLYEYSPTFSGGEGSATQFNMDGVEKVGLVKFDFLGLKNLDIVSYAQELVNEEIMRANAGSEADRLRLISSFQHLKSASAEQSLPALDVDLLALDDPAVFRLISRGDTNGIFQLESDGMKSMLRELKPDCFEDIVAAVALYRPGPMDQIPDYVARKHGRLAIEYPHPALEDILKPTYGHMVYQEQVMQAAQILAGYSLGQADLLRRAMGKKKREVMEEERLRFADGAERIHNVKKNEADRIFDLIEKFAGYGFNKSHAAAYAKITYQTAYLKAFHPIAFYAAQVTVHGANTTTVAKYLREARDHGIRILAPCINRSALRFRPEGEESLRFGLSAIKGLGDAALSELLRAREAGDEFQGLIDLAKRCEPRKFPRKAMGLLIDAGAMDCFKEPRRRLLASVETVYRLAARTHRDRAAGQMTLFSGAGMADSAADNDRAGLDDTIGSFSQRQRLDREFDALGLFLSGHPTAMYRRALRRLSSCGAGELARLWDPRARYGANASKEVRVGGIIVHTEFKNVVSYSNMKGAKDDTVIPRRAFLTLQDVTGQCEAKIQPELLHEVEELLSCGEPLLLTGTLSARRQQNDGADAQLEVALQVRRVERALDVFLREGVRCRVHLDAEKSRPDLLSQLQDCVQAHRGPMPLEFMVHRQGQQVLARGDHHHRIGPSLEYMDALDEILGSTGANAEFL